jgi:hypothetical protein
MNSVNQEYLDRGEGIYIAKVDSVESVAGLNKVWFKWWLPGDPRITKTEIRWIEGIETKSREYTINRTQKDSIVMEAILDDFPEGSFSFEFINWDEAGNRSVSIGTTVEVFGDRYKTGLRNRPIAVVTKFGNGYAAVWNASDCLYSDLSYRTVNGQTVSMRLPADSAEVTPRLLLLDYDGSGLVQTTYYLFETPVFSEIITVPSEAYTFYRDVSATLTASTTAVIGSGNFDLGGEGIGFHDSNENHDPGSNGANYRPDLGDYGSAAMDIEGNGGNIGYSNPDEWVRYTVDVQDEGYYEIDWYISVNSGSGSACHVEVDNRVFNSYPLVNNGNWSDWRYYCEYNGVVPPYLFLTKGKHTVKFQWDASGFNLNGLRMRPVDPNHITYKASRTGWTAESRNGNHDWGDIGGEAYRVLDGNRGTGWHSRLDTQLPQCLVIDMKETKRVDRFVMWHLPEGLANNWIYYGRIEVYLTDTPATPDIYQPAWGSPAAVYNYPGGFDGVTVNLDPGSKGRYLILYFQSSRASSYISFTELDVYVIL